MDDAERTAIIRRVGRSDPSASPWDDHSLDAVDPHVGSAADAAAGLASLSFITGAIRRRTRLWCASAAVGLVLGGGIYLAHPPPYSATAQALLTLGPNEDLNTAINTDVALAESRPVAALALHQLGLKESVSDLLSTYTATAITNRVVLIAVKASSSGEAVRRANDLTAAFLRFRADQLRAYQHLISASLDQQITQGQDQVASLTRQVTKLTGTIAPRQQTKLAGLQAQLTTAQGSLSSLEQAAQATRRTTQVETNTAVNGSYIIDAASPVVKSQKKTGAIYAASGLVGGLLLSLGFIVISALVSDRLRYRDDVAIALHAPVRLSVGRVHRRRLRPGRHGLAGADLPEVQRIVAHLRVGVADRPKGTALAMVATDRADVAAMVLATLALSCAKDKKRVILADLCPGAPAAHLLHATDPGVHSVNVKDGDQEFRLVVAIPEPGDAVPVGPLNLAARTAQPVQPGADLAAAYSSADVLLTLVDLDPMLGGDHLITWANDVVVMVTAGQSSWIRVEAVGEMVRLAGARLVSAVLVGADKTDESLGMARAPRNDRGAGGASRDLRPAGRDLLITVNGSSSDAPPDEL